MHKISSLIAILDKVADISIHNRVKLRDNSKILIAGASGLIGINLISMLRRLNALEGRGWYLTAILTPRSKSISRSIIEAYGIDIIEARLDQNIDYYRRDFDYVINAAGYGQPGKFLDNKIPTILLNTFGTWQLFEKFCKKDGSFLYLSSSEVYSGLSGKNKESEIGSSTPTHLRSSYIEAKRCGEALVNSYRSKSFSASSARLALAYGPGTMIDDKRVLNQFIMKALDGNIDLLDSGLATRTYGFVSDVTSQLLSILAEPTSAVYNVGGTSKVTILELAERIGEKTDSKVTLPFDTSANGLDGAPGSVELDLSLIEQHSSINGYIDLNTGLDLTIEWYKELRNYVN